MSHARESPRDRLPQFDGTSTRATAAAPPGRARPSLGVVHDGFGSRGLPGPADQLRLRGETLSYRLPPAFPESAALPPGGVKLVDGEEIRAAATASYGPLSPPARHSRGGGDRHPCLPRLARERPDVLFSLLGMKRSSVPLGAWSRVGVAGRGASRSLCRRPLFLPLAREKLHRSRLWSECVAQLESCPAASASLGAVLVLLDGDPQADKVILKRSDYDRPLIDSE